MDLLALGGESLAKEVFLHSATAQIPMWSSMLLAGAGWSCLVEQGLYTLS